jgi:HSP20 family protein
MALISLKTPESSLSRRTDEFFHPLRRQLNRIFDDFLSSSPLAMTSEMRTFPSVSSPAMNVSETEKSYKVSMEVPGVDEKHLEIAVSDGNLTIKGEKDISKEEKDNGFLTMERSYGSFFRSIPFDSQIDESKIKATLKHGVLMIEIPKTPEAVKNIKQISVQQL